MVFSIFDQYNVNFLRVFSDKKKNYVAKYLKEHPKRKTTMQNCLQSR